MSLGGGWEDLQMIDGTTKPFTTPRGMAARMYSWLIMSQPPCLALPWAQSHRFAFTKAHIATIREILVNPDMLPEPPFVVVLSDSGQKQLIFRAPVALSKDVFEVMLEDQPIRMTPAGLKERLELAAAISTKMGKPALKEIASFSFYTRAQKYGIVTELEEWAQVQHEPLSQLAAWLAPPMDKG
jgi:hypothetical protein